MTHRPKTIPLVMSADDGYAMQLAVAVRSLLDTLSSAEAVSLYVLDGGVSPENRGRCLDSWGDRCASVDWIRPSAEFLSALPNSAAFPPATFHRIAVAELLPSSLDRVIFADPDVTFLRSPRELLEIDMLGCPVAAVQDAYCPYIDNRVGMANFHEARNFVYGKSAVPGLSRNSPTRRQPYFNAGLMVLDLAMFRRERIGERLLRFCRDHCEELLWADQCALNACLAGRWLKIDSAWNVTPPVFRFPDHRASPFDAATLDRLRTSPFMVHFAGRSKPWWHGCDHPFTHAYWKVLDRTAWAGWRPDPVRDMAPPPAAPVRRTLRRRGIDWVLLRVPSAVRPWGGMCVALNQHMLRRAIDHGARGREPDGGAREPQPAALVVPRPPPGCGGSVDHYYHFLFDLALPLWTLFARIDTDARIAIPPAGPLTARIAEIFGTRVVVDAGELSPSVPRLPLVGMNPVGVPIRAAMLARFRRFVLDRAGVHDSKPPELVVLIERRSPDAYFTRASGAGGSGATRRSIRNHAEVLEALERAVRPGLRLLNVRLETMSLAEQAAVLSRTALLIGQHGAGLANALWMQPGHAVVELAHRSPSHFSRLSRICGHRFMRYEVGADHATVSPAALISWLRHQRAAEQFLT